MYVHLMTTRATPYLACLFGSAGVWEAEEETARRVAPPAGASFVCSRSFGAGMEEEPGGVATARAGEEEVEEEGAGRSTAWA